MRFFGINFHKKDDMSIETNAEDKMKSLYETSLTRARRKQYENPLTII